MLSPEFTDLAAVSDTGRVQGCDLDDAIDRANALLGRIYKDRWDLAKKEKRSVLRPAPSCPWWPYVWSVRTALRVGPDGRVPIGTQRLRAWLERELHPRLDALARLPIVDAVRIAIVGHSRGGSGQTCACRKARRMQRERSQADDRRVHQQADRSETL